MKAISRWFLGHLLCEMGPQRRCSLGSGTKELPRAGEGREDSGGELGGYR